MLQFENVVKTYRLGDSAWSFGPVSFRVEAGEKIAIVGKSGAGKSTLLHLLGALQQPDSGKIIASGEDLGRMAEKELNRFRNRNIGFIFQDFFLLNEFTLLENVAMPLLLRGIERKTAFKAAKSVLAEAELFDKEQNRPAELSGGQRQRAAIARAIVGEPKLILADEPTGNLDAATGKTILTLLKNLTTRTNATLILVTHDLEAANAMDRRIELSDGKIIADSSL